MTQVDGAAPEDPVSSVCRAVVLLAGRRRPGPQVEDAFRRAGIEIVGYAQSSTGALSLLGRRQPDTLISEGALTEDPAEEPEFLRRAYEVDASLNAILVADGLSNLEDALFAAAATRWSVDGGGSQSALAELGVPLTRREREVLVLAAEGFSNTEIARQLWVTRETVKFHLANAYRKLGATGRIEAARLARERGLI